MTLISILLGTLAAGIGSVWIAAALSFGMLARYTHHMLSLAAGALLSTALLHLLPEAFESHVDAHTLFLALLVGLVFFFLLDKAELWHHGHEHHYGSAAAADGHGHRHGDPRGHAHSHPHAPGLPHTAAVPDHSAQAHAAHAHAHAAQADAPHRHTHHAPAGALRNPGAWSVLAGDSVHCFGDGVLIASAFVADVRLGIAASVAVLAHEVPHHMGDLAVLRGSNNRRTALLKVSMAGALTALGGIAGYWLVDLLHEWLPFFLVAASSSFIYVALADLIPQLQQRLSARETTVQITWLAAGIGAVMAVSSMMPHAH